MSDYNVARAAFSECLARQVELGARIVAAGEALLDDQSAAGASNSRACIRELMRKARSGKIELKRLRGIIKRQRLVLEA